MNRVVRNVAIGTVIVGSLLAAKPAFSRNHFADAQRLKDRQETVFAIGKQQDRHKIVLAVDIQKRDPQRWVAYEAANAINRFIVTLDESAARDYVSYMNQGKMDQYFWYAHTIWSGHHFLQKLYPRYYGNYKPRYSSEHVGLINAIRDIESAFLSDLPNFVNNRNNIEWKYKTASPYGWEGHGTTFYQTAFPKNVDAWANGVIDRLSTRYKREFVEEVYNKVIAGTNQFHQNMGSHIAMEMRKYLDQRWETRFNPGEFIKVIGGLIVSVVFFAFFLFGRVLSGAGGPISGSEEKHWGHNQDQRRS